MYTISYRTRTLTMLNSNTVKIVYNDNVMIDLDDVIEDYKQYDIFTQQLRLKKLIISRKFTSMTADAR